MLNQDIPEEFYGVVDSIARRVQTKFSNLDWEDIRQDIWVDLLEQDEVAELVTQENPEPILYRKGVQVASTASYKDEISLGAYKYSVKVIRRMLNAGFLTDTNRGTLSEQEDLRIAYMQIQNENIRYAELLHKRYVEGVKPDNRADTDALQRAVTRLTTLMNRSWVKMSTRLSLSEDEGSYYIDDDEILDRITNER